MARGANFLPLRPAIAAPIVRIGLTIRPMGRRRIESSPVRTVKKILPARSPVRSRMPVPELPQSIGRAGSVSPHCPLPKTCNAVAVASNSNPHVPKRLSRIETIFAGAISRDGCLAVRRSTEHDGPVRNRLIAGHGYRTFEWTAWHDGQ